MSDRTLKVKVLQPFLYNGKLLKVGESIELNFDRAVRHMRVGDLERDEKAIEEYKNEQKAKAQAALKDSEADW